MTTTERTTMNGKPVVWRPAKTILNLESGFKDKLLCDGPTFSTGDACAYSCTFCYVPSMMKKAAYVPHDRPHEDMVVRRENALDVLFDQLTVKVKGGGRKPKYDNQNDNRVVYASPLVDVAANMELVRETVEACAMILELTNWQIRLLSKSNLLPKVALSLLAHAESEGRFALADVKRRMIFGVSTGTLDDKLAAAFEIDCPKVSKRLESLHWLQDNGFRTFGMICPILPMREDARTDFARSVCNAIRIDKCEHVWAEVMNARGESMANTVSALEAAGYGWEASELQAFAGNPVAWEHGYARSTFEALAAVCPPGKLRFLQYVTPKTLDWWKGRVESGAVLLGAAASH